MSDGRGHRSAHALLDPPRLLKRSKMQQHAEPSSPKHTAVKEATTAEAYPRYAHLSYAPATKTTVVTTTTTTTTSFPAFLVDSPQDLHTRDPVQYPLASAQTPASLVNFSFEAGGRIAFFREESSRAQNGQQVSPHTAQDGFKSESSPAVKAAASARYQSRKRPASQMFDQASAAADVQASGSAMKKIRHRLRDIHNTPITPRSRTITRSRRYEPGDDRLASQEPPVSLAGDPSLETPHQDNSNLDIGPSVPACEDLVQDALPPSPPSFISTTAGVATPPVADHDLLELMPTAQAISSQSTVQDAASPAVQDNSLPSPMLSPVTATASPLLEDGHFADVNDALPEKALLPFSQSATFGANEEATNHADTATGPLQDLFELVGKFDACPIELQRYVMYQLLRRSNKNLLQFTANLVNPALKCDFFARLPTELSLNIVRYLDARSLCRAAQVSRRWRELTDSYEQVWKDLVEGEGFTLPQDEVDRAIREGWKWQGSVPAEKNLLVSLLREPDDSITRSASPGQSRMLHSIQRPELKRSSGEADQFRRRRRLMRASDGSPSDRLSIGMHIDAHAYTADLPELGLKSLRIPHLYKSIYRRHHGFRSSWMKPETKPHHIAFQAHGRHVVTCLQFDDDKILTGSDDTKINVWDTNTGAARKELLGHEGGVWALQYDGNTLVSGSTDRTVRIWDIEKGKCTHVFQGHTSTVRCLVILKPAVVGQNADGSPIMMPKEPLIITGSRDSTLRVWKLPKATDAHYNPRGAETTPNALNPYFVRALHGHSQSVRAIAAHGDTLVSGSYDSTVRVWRISNGDLVHRLAGHAQKVYSVILDHERNRCISGSMDSLVKVWSLETGHCIFNLDGHSSLVGLLDLNSSRLVSAAADWSLRIWDPETGHCHNTLAAHTGAITCFQHDGMKVVSGSDRSLKMWDIRSGELVRDLLTDLSGGWQVKFNDRKCVAAVQRSNRTYIEVLDFGAARDGMSAEKLGVRTLVDEYGDEITDDSEDEDFEE